MFTGGVEKLAEFPAASVTVTVAVSPVPSPVITTGPLLLVEATPDVPSEVVNGKLTSLLFQPEAFGAGEGGPNTSVGGVASRLSVRDAESVPPADVAVHVNVVPGLSVDRMGSSQPSVERIGEIGSSTDQSTWTSLVYQPSFPCGNGRLEPIVGGYRSMLKEGDV